jgi:signal transduction histidine kinase
MAAPIIAASPSAGNPGGSGNGGCSGVGRRPSVTPSCATADAVQSPAAVDADTRTPRPLRAPSPDILAQLGRARTDSALAPLLDATGDMAAILNERRQVVFANRPLRKFAGSVSVEQLCGLRPGDVLECVNAAKNPGGCGAADGCAFCGAAAAIEETLRTGAPAERECRITSGAEGRAAALDILARTAAFSVDGTRFVLLVLADISASKRRLALERIFFHDILNTVSSFAVYLDLLKARVRDEDGRRLVGRLESIAAALVEEIRGQKILVSAENRTLSVQRELIESRDLAERLIQQFEGQEAARGRTIAVAGFSESVTFVSDDSLVRRVLGNMVKNALEAGPEGATVTLGFRPDAEGRVRFEVHNEGVIPAHIAPQVFQRSFSTKGTGRGLGTWSMKLLAEDYLGGAVSFRTSPAEGTTFSLVLPRMPTLKAVSESSRVPGQELRGT